VPTLKLKSGSTGTRKSPATKPAPKRTPARKPAAKATPTRKPAAKRSPAPAQAETNGGARTPRLPEGWTKGEFTRVVKDMQKARKVREAAEENLKEAQATANQMALDLIASGLQMSIVSNELDLSRQWLYKIMEDAGVKTARQAQTKRGRTASAGRTSKPAAKKRPAAKASAAKPAAKRTAPARKAPARKPPAAPAVTGRGRVRIK
jgi:hypothetical protein